jgi:hypothetical protein
MLKLISKETALRLMSFPVGKKVAFLLLLYERMRPATYFYLAEGLAFSVFQEAREKFWGSLVQGAPPISWAQLRDDILDATPDTEDSGSKEAGYALDAALVAADIAGLLEDGKEMHIVEAMQYALNSLDAYVLDQLGVVFVYKSIVKSLNELVEAHALVRNERRKEEGDVLLLSTMPDTPWSEDVVAMLRDRAEVQGSLLDNLRGSSQADG